MPSPGKLTIREKAQLSLWLALSLLRDKKNSATTDYQKYQDEKKFSKKLDKQMKEEIERFINSRK